MAQIDAARPGRVTLEGQYVRLRPISDESADDLWDAGADETEIWRWMSGGPFGDIAGLRTYLAGMRLSDDPLLFAIDDLAAGRTTGFAALMRIEPKHKVIEVGHILYTRELRRTRGATEAMYLLARYCFDELGYRRYEWKCNALNAPSRAAALRLGFQFEGIFRQHMIIKGENRDTAWFSMLDGEWPARKAQFERWLEPSNFGPNGQQLSSL